MKGPLLELVLVGAIDQHITASPEISYFKAVYKRHTNFAMESVKQTFGTSPVLGSGSITATCKIGRVGDLLGEVYFNFRLPAIYSSSEYKFRWIKNIGEYIIYKYSLRMDTQLVDEGYGEWIEVWNELSMPSGKRGMYNEMIGNVPDMNNPLADDTYAVVKNNMLTYETYAQSTGPNDPSIPERRLMVPIPFWFTKNPALALPLVALQYQNVEVVLELRSVDQLYQIYDENADVYVSPARYAQLYPNKVEDITIGNFLTPVGQPPAPNQLFLDAYLECNYIFLDKAEQTLVATSSLDYLVERTYRTEVGGIRGTGTIDLKISNAVKELVWFARRSDANNYNDWTNFTATYPENKAAPIMSTAKLIWNGMDRIEEKPGDFFNKIQPYQHHTNSPRQGIYCYNFGLYPEKWQPSGSFNASMISRNQMFVTTTTPGQENTFVVYALYYNIFHVVSGRGGMVNAN